MHWHAQRGVRKCLHVRLLLARSPWPPAIGLWCMCCCGKRVSLVSPQHTVQHHVQAENDSHRLCSLRSTTRCTCTVHQSMMRSSGLLGGVGGLSCSTQPWPGLGCTPPDAPNLAQPSSATRNGPDCQAPATNTITTTGLMHSGAALQANESARGGGRPACSMLCSLHAAVLHVPLGMQRASQ